jgi:hypothetical protein
MASLFCKISREMYCWLIAFGACPSKKWLIKSSTDHHALASLGFAGTGAIDAFGPFGAYRAIRVVQVAQIGQCDRTGQLAHLQAVGGPCRRRLKVATGINVGGS